MVAIILPWSVIIGTMIMAVTFPYLVIYRLSRLSVDIQLQSAVAARRAGVFTSFKMVGSSVLVVCIFTHNEKLGGVKRVISHDVWGYIYTLVYIPTRR